MDLRIDLLKAADAYCAKRGISHARLATIVVNDGKFFKRVGGGGGFTVATYQNFMQYFKNNPPRRKSKAKR